MRLSPVSFAPSFGIIKCLDLVNQTRFILPKEIFLFLILKLPRNLNKRSLISVCLYQSAFNLFSVDPTLLERAAAAVKELDKSKNAQEAFQMARIAEATKQKEIQAALEAQQTERARILIEKTQVEYDERRKTTSHMQDEERRTLHYKNQIEAEAYQKKLEDQKRKDDEWLRKQEQQFLRQEEARKRTEIELEDIRIAKAREQAKIDRELQSQRIAEETKGAIMKERENIDIRIRELRAKAAEERETRLASLSSIGGAINTLLEDKKKMGALVGGLFAISLGFFTAKNSTRLAVKYFESIMSKPSLIRETSRWTWDKGFQGLFKRKASLNLQEHVVLPAQLAERLEWTSNSLVQARNNGTPFRHILLHGPPGTGKTLFARTLAHDSGLDYAIMAGGDVGPLGRDAVTEINKLFAWANKSKRGLILFIDEAEAFLHKGRGVQGGMSEDVKNALSSFLSHTGTESDKFCIVMATNVLEAFDRAVIDRVDENFEFPLPGEAERKKMISMFVDRYLKKPTKTGKTIQLDEAIDDAYWDLVAKKTQGFSGRQLAKLVINYQSAVFGSGSNQLTKGMADVILEWRIKTFEADSDTMERRDAEKLRAQVSGTGPY